MADFPSYAILGKGRWAGVIRGILSGEGRRVTRVEQTRRSASETVEEYKGRLCGQMRNSGSQIAWLCTQPGPHVPQMVEAAIDAGLHVIAEKPWSYSPRETRELSHLAQDKCRSAGVHFEYCLLDGVEVWRRRFNRGAGLRFGGRFSLSGGTRAQVPAIDNLGCHLLAIQQYAVPDASIAQISCAYGQSDERRVWLQEKDEIIASIDFLGSREPIIQRYVARFESAIGGDSFPFDLEFAGQVARNGAAWKQRDVR
jgi:predicted dehydrogenase